MAADNISDLRNSSLISSRLEIIHLKAINFRTAWEGGAGSQSISFGTAYYEATVNITTTGVCRIGWSKCHRERNILLGLDYHSIGFGSTAKKSHDKTFKDYGNVVNDGDVIGCYIDFSRGVAAFSTNGISHGPAFTRDGGEIHPLSKLFESALYPAFCLKEASVTLNFGPFEDIEERTAIFETAAPQIQGADYSNLTALRNDWIHSKLSGSGSHLVITNLMATNSNILMMKGTGSQSVSSGTAYYEATVTLTGQSGYLILGWSIIAKGSILGLGFDSMGFCSSGHIIHENRFQNYGAELRSGDVIGCYIDFSSGVASFSTNGKSYGPAFIRRDFCRSSKLFEAPLYPAFCLKEASVTLNFGPFKNLEDRTAIFKIPALLEMAKNPWIDRKDRQGNTHLHIAAFDDRFTAVRDLIERGASVNVTNDHQRSPLHTAVIQGCYDVALLLVDAGSNLFQDDIVGNTPLEVLFYQVSNPKKYVCCPEGGRLYLERVILRSRFPRSTFRFLFFCKLQSLSLKKHLGLGVSEGGLGWDYRDYLRSRVRWCIDDIDDESHNILPYIFQGREYEIARLSDTLPPPPSPSSASTPPPPLPTDQEQAALTQLQSCEIVFTQDSLVRLIVSFL